MAVSANTVWELRTTGANTNGGGFVAGASGTDYSQQDAAQLSVTDAACTGNTTVTSVTGGFTAAMIGSIMYLSSGPGWYEITARASSNSITIDRAGPNASGMTANVGGALATFAGLATAWGTTAKNKAFVKSGAYTSTATNTFAAGHSVQSASEPANTIIGYKTVRGDIGQTAAGTFTNNADRPVLTLQTNTGLTGISCTNQGWLIENIVIDCGSLGTSRGVNFGSGNAMLINCKISNFTQYGCIFSGAIGMMLACEVTGGTSAATVAVYLNNSCSLYQSNIHDNVCSGIQQSSSSTIAFNRIVNNTGASSDGIITAGSLASILHNTISGSGRDGIGQGIVQLMAFSIKGNIFASNGRYGLNPSSTALPAGPWWDGNAYYGNTSGTRNNCDSTSGIYGVSAYTNVLDVLVTDGSPFTNAAGGDYTLNSTALRGALLRATATPGAIPGVSQVGYLDFGCFQHQDSGGGGTVGGFIIGG